MSAVRLVRETEPCNPAGPVAVDGLIQWHLRATDVAAQPDADPTAGAEQPLSNAACCGTHCGQRTPNWVPGPGESTPRASDSSPPMALSRMDQSNANSEFWTAITI